ncbi:MAG TPA: glyoxalase [Alphaproteobacteria bacterium]|nr:glyoxalase [Rhodobiaceae bacterium]HBA42740.1 glyoxalase [Alphaproteobacteria bacterium]
MPAGKEALARDFYSGVLGIPEKEKPKKLAARGGAWFETENLKVHLGVDKNFTPAKKAHIAFLTKNVGEIEKLCIENGYEVYSDQPLEGYTRIYVLDPFGNRLEFMEKLEI